MLTLAVLWIRIRTPVSKIGWIRNPDQYQMIRSGSNKNHSKQKITLIFLPKFKWLFIEKWLLCKKCNIHTQNMGYERFFNHMLKFFLVPNPFLPGSGSVSFLPGSGSVSKFVLDPDPYQNDTDPPLWALVPLFPTNYSQCVMLSKNQTCCLHWTRPRRWTRCRTTQTWCGGWKTSPRASRSWTSSTPTSRCCWRPAFTTWSLPRYNYPFKKRF